LQFCNIVLESFVPTELEPTPWQHRLATSIKAELNHIAGECFCDACAGRIDGAERHVRKQNELPWCVEQLLRDGL
tara:strand:- start:283 stop:507 length:225 start_codon:yes stop_codon:yes gene_type:complete